MKKRTLALLLSLILLVSLLAACGKAEQPAEGPRETSPGQTEQTEQPAQPAETEPEQPEDPGQSGPAQTEEGTEPAGSEGTENPEDPGETEETEEPEDPEDPEEPEEPLPVFNNGSDFVRVGERVYFRLYDTENMEPQLWGDFIHSWSDVDARAVLCAYDTASGRVEELCPASPYGPLRYSGGSFWLMDYSGEETEYASTARYSRSGELKGKLQDTSVSDVDPTGRFMAGWSYDETAGESRLNIYENGVLFYTIAQEEGFSGILGFGPEGEVVALHTAYVEESYSYTASLYEYLPEGGRILLGEIDSGEWGGWPNPEAFLLGEDGESFAALIGFYIGSASTPYYVAVKAALGQEDSLEELGRLDGFDAEESAVPGLCQDADGGFAMTKRQPGTVYLSDGIYGDLLYADEEGEEKLLVRDFLSYGASGSFVLQTGAVFEDAAYLIVAEARRAEESDVGWREAYEPLDLFYLRVPLNSRRVETICGPAWTGTPQTEPSPAGDCAAIAGYWLLYGAEVEGYELSQEELNFSSSITIGTEGTANYVYDNYQQSFSRCETWTDWDENGERRNCYYFTDPDTEDGLFVYLTDPVSMVASIYHVVAFDGGSESISWTGFYSYEPTEGAPLNGAG